MKTYQKIVECFAVLSDPRSPERKPAFDLHVVTMIDLEDGSPPFADPRAPVQVLTTEQAKSRGLDIPQIAAAFDTEANAENDRNRQKLSRLEALEEEVATLRAQAKEGVRTRLPANINYNADEASQR